MIEKTVLDYLSAKLRVPAYMEVPEEPPESFVIIEKTGSSCRNRIYTATLAIRSYSDRLYHAAELNEAVKTAMDGITGLDSVSRAELNGDYNFTDTASKRYRYQAVYVLTHY